MSINEILKDGFIDQQNERVVKVEVRPYLNNGGLAPISYFSIFIVFTQVALYR